MRGHPYHLPELLAEIADVAGLPAALAIAQVKGGTRTHFPSVAADDHWLVGTVGREAADKLCYHFRVNHKGGVSTVVPLGPTKLYDRTRFRALELSSKGASISEIARQLGVATRTVEKWNAAERARLPGRRTKPGRAGMRGNVNLDGPCDPVKDGLMRSLADEREPLSQPPALDPTKNALSVPDVDGFSLPPLLAEIAGVAGIGAAIVLGRMKGARVLHLTNHAGRGSELNGIVGRGSGEKIIGHFRAKHGGDIELLIPFAQHADLCKVGRWAGAMLDAGHAAADVAEWIGLTAPIVEHLVGYSRGVTTSERKFRPGFPYDTELEG